MRTEKSNVHVSSVKNADNGGRKKWNRANKTQVTEWVEKWMKLMLFDRLHVDISFSDMRECFRISSCDRLVTWAEWRRTEETTVDHIANILLSLSSHT